MDNQQIARAILDAVGPDNITEAYNCMTRLRLRVKDATVTKEELKKIDGIKGVIFNDGEIHIVLGPGKAENVTKECKRLLAERTKTGVVDEIAAPETAGTGSGSKTDVSASEAVARIIKTLAAADWAYLYPADSGVHRLRLADGSCDPFAENQSGSGR